MADNVVKLRVDSNEYESKIKRASEGLQALGRSLRDAGKTFADADAKQVEFTRELGKMQTVSNTAKGKIAEMSAAFINLKSQYLQMTDAEKQSPIGQAMSKSLDELKTRTIEAKRGLESLNRELSETKMPDIDGKVGGGLFSGLGDKMGGALQVFAGNMLTKAAGAVASLGSEMVDMVQQGIEMAKAGEGIRIAFERLGRGDILDGLREATHGTVTDLELMKAAVKFNDFKLPVEELGTMLAFAQQKAKDTGQSVDYMVDSIVTGLGRKSLMILDNLGLSATEVKEKMAETGDMTKAVGAIIREQMAKAGDYVETAADRATKADVELKNAMEDLGRTFQPLSDAGASLWNNLKIGALDLLNNAVRPLIDALTEAGRIRSKYAQQGGDRRVNGFLDTLKGISNDDRRRDTYNRQLAKFDSKIGSYQQYLEDYKAQQEGIRKGNPNLAAGDRVAAFQKQTGLSFFSDVKEQLAVFQKQRAEYVMGAKAILEGTPAPSPADSSDGKGGKGGKGGKTGTDINYATDSIMAQQAEVSRLTKLWQSAGAAVRDDYKAQLDEAQYLLDRMTSKEKFDPTNMRELTDLRGTTAWAPSSLFTAGTAPVAPDTIKFSDGLQKRLEYEEKRNKDSEKKEVNLTSEMSKIAGGVSGIFSGIESLGVELPQGMKDVMGGIQGMISILTSISTIVTAIQAISAADTLIPFARGGIVKAAGGTIVGNSYSGDNLRGIGPGGQLYGLNAQEVVLNRAQQGNLVSQLEGANGRSVNVRGVLQGEQIFLAAERWSKRTGKGEIVTW